MSCGRLDRLFLAGLAALIAAYVAIFAYYVLATIITVPVYDLLGWILHYDQYWRVGDWGRYLWLPHNEHRLIWSRLLVVVDIGWFRGTGVPFLVFDTACFALTVGGLIRPIWRADFAIELRATLAAAVILLLAGTYAATYCSVPIMGVYVHTTGLFVVSLTLLDGVDEEGPGSAARRVAAIVAASLAVFGVAGGLLAPLVLLWSAWAGGLGRGWLLAIGAIAAILIALYLPGLPIGHDADSLAWGHLLKLADYYVRLLGLPWSHAPSLMWFGRLIGCIVLGAGIFTLLRGGILHRPVDQLERIGLSLLVFSLLIAAMAAVSRSKVAPELTMPIRYGIFAALAQIGLIFANAPRLEWLWYAGYLKAFRWAMLPLVAIFLAQQVAGGQAAVAVTDRYKDAYRDFVGGQWNAATARYVFPDQAGAKRALGVMRDLGIYQYTR